MKSSYKFLKLLLCFCIAITIIVGIYLSTEVALFTFDIISLWFLGFLYLFLFIYFVFMKCFLNNFNKVNRPIYFYGSVTFVSFLVLLILPINYFTIIKNNTTSNYMKSHNTFKIEVVDEKNNQSTGNDVWIEGIVENSKDVNLYNIPISYPWIYREDRIFTDTPEASLTITLDENSEYGIIVRKQNSGGKINVTIGEYQKIYDLYSENLEQRAYIDLSEVISIQNEENNTNKIIFYFLVYLIVWFVVFSLSIYLRKKYSKII